MTDIENSSTTSPEQIARNVFEAFAVLEKVGLPVYVSAAWVPRDSAVGDFAHNNSVFLAVVERALDASPSSEVYIEHAFTTIPVVDVSGDVGGGDLYDDWEFVFGDGIERGSKVETLPTGVTPPTDDSWYFDMKMKQATKLPPRASKCCCDACKNKKEV